MQERVTHAHGPPRGGLRLHEWAYAQQCPEIRTGRRRTRSNLLGLVSILSLKNRRNECLGELKCRSAEKAQKILGVLNGSELKRKSAEKLKGSWAALNGSEAKSSSASLQ